MTDRRYRGKQSRPIPVWNGILEHCERIGDAIWEFLWCLDRITAERDGVGVVSGGAPVKLETIIADLKGTKETVRRHLKKLVDRKYVRMRRTPYGQVIEVLHSRKFGIWQKEKPKNDVSPPERNIISEPEKPKNDVSKEDAAVKRQQEEAAAAAGSTLNSTPTPNPEPENSVWSFLGIPPCGSLPFRRLLEDGWANRNGGPYSILIGDALNAWEAIEREKPKGCAPLFRALGELRKRERDAVSNKPEDEIHILTPDEINV